MITVIVGIIRIKSMNLGVRNLSKPDTLRIYIKIAATIKGMHNICILKKKYIIGRVKAAA